MQVGLISDIHGNRVALDAVLAAMPPVDAIVCAGDVVGYNPFHDECVATVRDREIPTVSGNHDRAVVGDDDFSFNSMAGAGVQHAREQLSADAIDWLAGLPHQHLLFDDRIRVVHGHPDNPDRYTFPREFSPRLLGDEDVLVMGHTHVQHAEQYSEGIVVNPGSVGQPRDGDPRAAYAVLDLDALSVTTHRTEYDIEQVQAAIGDTGLPSRLGRRLALGE